jgi:DNA helicase-2/ATP-dependent DNA helicase PcrA
MSEHKLTEEQENFINEWLLGVCILLQARAGTGKTSTIIDLAKKLLQVKPEGRGRIAVFANRNSAEMLPKLPSNCAGSTWHVFCKSMFRIRPYGQPDNFKVSNIIRDIPGYNPWKEYTKEGKEKAKENAAALRELVGLVKNSILKPNMANVLDLIKHFGIIAPNPPEVLADHAIKVVDISDENTKVIDFDDMVRFPAIYDWVKPDSDWFISDETQDNTPIRTHIMNELMKMGCQVGGVGDDRQSIMGFAGADCDSMQHIIELGLKLMPLTINFRCGKNIIKEAQKIVPDIQAWENSPDGKIHYDTSKEGNIIKLLKSGDAVLARRNNEILPICFQLIKEGKKATIQGKDFATQIKGLIKSFKADDIQDFNDKIHAWYDKQVKFRGEDENSMSAEKFGVLKYFADNAITMADIDKKIDGIFSDEASEYKLSTAHRAKGLEWDNVFIMNNANFKITRQKTTWGYRQEENLHYVAVTRAKKELTFLD